MGTCAASCAGGVQIVRQAFTGDRLPARRVEVRGGLSLRPPGADGGRRGDGRAGAALVVAREVLGVFEDLEDGTTDVSLHRQIMPEPWTMLANGAEGKTPCTPAAE